MRLPFVAFAAITILATTAPVASAQNIVNNPGFETGDFTGWVYQGTSVFSGVDNVAPHSGNFGAYFGEVGSTSSISQSLATTPNTWYTLSFWTGTNATAGVHFFSVWWNGSPVDLRSNTGAFGPFQFSYNVFAIDATSELFFGFRNDDSFWDFDDVSVTGPPSESTVPEPASMTLLATGLAGVAAARKRRRNQA